jgi:hypothetical protein
MVRRALAVLATGAIVAMGLGGRDVVRLAHELRTARDAQLEHTRRADVLARGGIRVDYYRSSSMEFALYFGNSTAWHLYGPLLAQLYPQRIFFNIYGGVFEKFSRTLAPEEVFGNGSVFLVGNALEYLPPGVRVPIPAGWEMTLIDRNGDKTVHQLQPKR